MMTPRIVRGSPEKQFAVIRNVDSAALVYGDLVAFETATAATKGFGVIGSAGAAALPAGVIADASIAVGADGLMQVWGYHPSVKSQSGTVGTHLVPSATAKNVANGAANIEPSLFVGYPLLAHNAGTGRTGVMLRLL